MEEELQFVISGKLHSINFLRMWELVRVMIYSSTGLIIVSDIFLATFAGLQSLSNHEIVARGEVSREKEF